MPKKLLNIFFLTFSKFNYNIIWQINSEPSKLFINEHKNLPSNIYIYNWLPLKILLGLFLLFFYI